jgi:cytochrome P450
LAPIDGARDGRDAVAATLPPAVSGAPIVQALRLRSRPDAFFDAARREHGETFRIRMPSFGEAVVVSDVDSVKRVFTSDRINAIARSSGLGGMLGERSLVHQEGDEHLRRRRLMSPPFNPERLRVHEETIAEATEREVDGWPVGEVFRLHPAMQRISLEVILRVIFGIQDGGRREALRDRIVAALTSPTVPPVGRLDPLVRALPPYRFYPRKIERIHELLDDEIAERRGESDFGERADTLSILMQARFEDGSEMDDRELRDQLEALLVAGHESIATSLAWCLDFLLHQPETLERLLAELAKDDGDAYLGAVVEETLRIRPAVPLTARRLGDATELGGYRLEAGSIIVVGIYLTNTSPETYREPYDFRPERFLDGGPETFSWIPFGGGTRRCIGGAFAEFEMRAVLRTVLQTVALEAGRGTLDVPKLPNLTLRPARGVPVRVTAKR